MKTTIGLRKLGNSDLFLSPIGLGCWQFSRGKGFIGNYWSFVDESEIIKIIQQSLAGGSTGSTQPKLTDGENQKG